MTTLITPKITLISRDRGKRYQKTLKIEKSKNLLRLVAKNFQKRHPRVEVSVVYGFAKNAYGKRVLFKNEGTYDNWEDLGCMLEAFIDKDLWIKK